MVWARWCSPALRASAASALAVSAMTAIFSCDSRVLVFEELLGLAKTAGFAPALASDIAPPGRPTSWLKWGYQRLLQNMTGRAPTYCASAMAVVVNAAPSGYE